MIPKIELNADDALRRIAELARGLQNDEPARAQIGELAVLSTKARFGTSTSPSGEAWKPLSETTIGIFLSKLTKGYYKRIGKDASGNILYGDELNKRGEKRLANRKPLVGESRRLSTQIFYNLVTGAVEIGSPLEYAGVQNFGQPKGASGSMSNGSPIPWGDIPARQFLGVSDQDGRDFVSVYELYIAGLVR